MLIVRFFFILLVLLATPFANAQTIAFTFDDGLDPRTNTNAAKWNGQILQALSDNQVTAMLLPAGKNIDSPAGMALVGDWGTAGHLIANHTYQHRNLNATQMTAQEFLEDVTKADALLNNMPGWTPRLRFPYLKEGDTLAKRDAVRNWMHSYGYRPAGVSIDASDWYYNQRFLAWQAAHPDADTRLYRDAYLAHLWDRATYYDRLAQALGRTDTAHVLLLHTNAINAAFIGDVIAMFRSRGWIIVSPDKAFADPLYTAEPDTVPAGEGILWALAKQEGVEGLRYPAEDSVYEEKLLDRLEAEFDTPISSIKH